MKNELYPQAYQFVKKRSNGSNNVRSQPKLNAGNWIIRQLQSTSPTSAASVNIRSKSSTEYTATVSDSVPTLSVFQVFLSFVLLVPSTASPLFLTWSIRIYTTCEKAFSVVANPNFQGLDLYQKLLNFLQNPDCDWFCLIQEPFVSFS